MSNRAEVLAAYQSYLDAFVASDEQAIRECVRWPRALIGADRAESVDEFPYSPTDLKRPKDWATSAGPRSTSWRSRTSRRTSSSGTANASGQTER
jgi:hypothetical protein